VTGPDITADDVTRAQASIGNMGGVVWATHLRVALLEVAPLLYARWVAAALRDAALSTHLTLVTGDGVPQNYVSCESLRAYAARVEKQGE
jgi:hypothetical protein